MFLPVNLIKNEIFALKRERKREREREGEEEE
jgi:hypothetical protein